MKTIYFKVASCKKYIILLYFLNLYNESNKHLIFISKKIFIFIPKRILAPPFLIFLK
jgi:hypothetical protein